jgi:hypothetical protein
VRLSLQKEVKDEEEEEEEEEEERTIWTWPAVGR